MGARLESNASNYLSGSVTGASEWTLTLHFQTHNLFTSWMTLLEMLFDSTFVHLYHNGNNERLTLYRTSAVAGSTISIDTWYYLAVTRSASGNVIAYLDEVQDSQVASPTGTTTGLRFGSNAMWNEPGNITIAAIKAWTAVLSGSEITAERNSEDAIRASGLWAVWKLANGALTADSSGNSHPLTLTGTVPYAAGPTFSGGGGVTPAAISSTATVHAPTVYNGPRHIGTAYSGGGTFANFSFSMPAGAQTGDLLVVMIVCEQASTGRTYTFGQDNAGWANIVNNFPGAQALQQAVWWNTIDGTDITAATTVTVTQSATDDCAGALMVFRYADTTTPFTAITTEEAETAGNATATAKTGLNTYQMVLCGVASAYGATWTPPANWVEIADNRSSTAASNVSLAAGYRQGVTSTGADAFVPSTTDLWMSFTAVLNAPRQTVAPDAISGSAAVYAPTVALAGGPQTVTPDLVGSAEQVHAPTLAPGAFTVTPDAIGAGAAVYAPTLAVGAVTVAPDAIASAAAVHAPTLAVGAVTVTPDAISSGAQVYASTLATGQVTVTPDAIASGETVYAPTLYAGAVTVTPDAIASTATVHAPTVTATGAIVPDAIGSAAQVFSPTITPGAVGIAPDAISSTAAVHAPAITTGATVQPDHVASVERVFAPALAAGPVEVAPEAISSSAAVHAVTVTAGAVTVTPDSIASGAQVYAVALTTVVTVAPDAVAGAAAVYAPAVLPGAVTVAPDAVGSAAVVYAPFVGSGTTQTVAPDAVAGAAQVYAVALVVWVVTRGVVRGAGAAGTMDGPRASSTIGV